MSRARSFGLLAALVVLAGVAVWNQAWSTERAASSPRARAAVVDPETTLVVPSVAEARAAQPLGLPLAALAAAVAVALLVATRRDARSVRASYPIRQRLVRASRRAPPVAIIPAFA